MTTASAIPVGMDSLPEFSTLPELRRSDVHAKHALVADLLEARGLDGLVLQEPANLSWFSSGGDFLSAADRAPVAAMFVTRDARVIITNNVHSQYVFERLVPELGFQLKERSWPESRRGLIDDLCRGRRVASDTAVDKAVSLATELRQLRMCLTELEQQRCRALGRLLVHALEATARSCQPGQSEAEIAGEVAHRLVKRKVRPVSLSVAADGVLQRHRHWTYSERLLERNATISATASRWGLHVSASRTIVFGTAEDEFVEAYNHASLLQATAFYFTVSNWTVAEVWKRVRRIYEKFGRKHEWELAEQGALLGYMSEELPLLPGSEQCARPGMAFHWRPSVGPCLVSDSTLVTSHGPNHLTPVEYWPTQTVQVKQYAVECPAILRRQPGVAGATPEEREGLAHDTALSLDVAAFGDLGP